MTDHRDHSESPFPQRLFVYGSLAPGEANEHVLRDCRGHWEPATIRGRLVKSGWGSQIGYPALVLDPQGGLIEGFLFTSDQLAALWDTLDRFEGDDYRRVSVRVRSRDSGTTRAYVYVFNGY